MSLLGEHEKLKRVRHRGTECPPDLAVMRYLRGLEAELERVREQLDSAWGLLEGSRDFRKCSQHMDRAQQRIHRVIRKLAGRKAG